MESEELPRNASIWVEQRLRLKRIASVCALRNRTISKKPKLMSRLITIDKGNVLFGFIPKVACKTWKGLIAEVVRKLGPNQNGEYLLKRFHDNDEIEKRLKEYKKVVFVRNPLVRVLSAYLSKFRNAGHLQKIWERLYGIEILGKFRNGSQELANKLVSMGIDDRPFLNVTFSEFVQFVTYKGRNHEMNRMSDHFLPQHIVSHVCEIGYDFIGKYENLADEGSLSWNG